jgi:hypothetical protein
MMMVGEGGSLNDADINVYIKQYCRYCEDRDNVEWISSRKCLTWADRDLNVTCQ